MYTHHVSQPNGLSTKLEYYMNQFGGWSLTGNKDSFLQGTTAFRNGVDWAEEQRNAAIEHAMAVANGVITNDDDHTDNG